MPITLKPFQRAAQVLDRDRTYRSNAEGGAEIDREATFNNEVESSRYFVKEAGEVAKTTVASVAAIGVAGGLQSVSVDALPRYEAALQTIGDLVLVVAHSTLYVSLGGVAALGLVAGKNAIEAAYHGAHILAARKQAAQTPTVPT